MQRLLVGFIQDVPIIRLFTISSYSRGCWKTELDRDEMCTHRVSKQLHRVPRSARCNLEYSCGMVHQALHSCFQQLIAHPTWHFSATANTPQNFLALGVQILS